MNASRKSISMMVRKNRVRLESMIKDAVDSANNPLEVGDRNRDAELSMACIAAMKIVTQRMVETTHDARSQNLENKDLAGGFETSSSAVAFEIPISCFACVTASPSSPSTKL